MKQFDCLQIQLQVLAQEIIVTVGVPLTGEISAMATFLVNSPVVTAYGTYVFRGPIDPKEALALLDHDFVSAVGHAGAAEFLTEQLGIDVPASRAAKSMGARRSGDSPAFERAAAGKPHTFRSRSAARS